MPKFDAFPVALCAIFTVFTGEFPFVQDLIWLLYFCKVFLITPVVSVCATYRLLMNSKHDRQVQAVQKLKLSAAETILAGAKEKKGLSFMEMQSCWM